MFCCAGRICRTRFCALVFAFVAGSACALQVNAQAMLPNGGAVPAPYGPPPMAANPYTISDGQPMYPTAPPNGAWVAPPGAQPQFTGPMAANPYTTAVDPTWGQPVIAEPAGEPWSW